MEPVTADQLEHVVGGVVPAYFGVLPLSGGGGTTSSGGGGGGGDGGGGGGGGGGGSAAKPAQNPLSPLAPTQPSLPGIFTTIFSGNIYLTQISINYGGSNVNQNNYFVIY